VGNISTTSLTIKKNELIVNGKTPEEDLPKKQQQQAQRRRRFKGKHELDPIKIKRKEGGDQKEKRLRQKKAYGETETPIHHA